MMTRKVISFLFTFGILCISTNMFASDLDEFEKDYKHAYTYYWLGIAEKGDIKSFETALIYLASAKESLAVLQLQLNEESFNKFQSSVRLLEKDLIKQQVISRNFFTGRFPLTRFLGEPLFLNPDSFGTYEMIVSPERLASGKAANKIGDIISQGLWGATQLPIFIFSKNNTLPEMESVSRAMFKNWHKVKVYDNAYLSNLLNIDLDDFFNASPDALPKTELENIHTAIGANLIAFTSIELYHKIDNIHFYKFLTTIFEKGQTVPVQTITHYELVRDKRSSLAWIGFFASILLLFSIFTFYILNLRKNFSLSSLSKLLILPSLCWLTGIISSLIVLSLLSPLKPAYQTNIYYSFWWVPIVFLFLFIVPAILIRKALTHFDWIDNYKGIKEESASLYLCTSFGVTTVLGIGFLLYHQGLGIAYLITVSYLIGLCFYSFGRITGKITPRSFSSIIPFVFFLPIAGLLLAGNSIGSLSSAFIITGFLHLVYAKDKAITKTLVKGDEFDPTNINSELFTLNDFQSYVTNPPFYKTEQHNAIMESMIPYDEGKSVILCIEGREGVGKTATALELIRSRLGNVDHGLEDILVIKSFAEENNEETVPFSAIRNALKDFFEINPFESSESQTEKIDQMLDGIFKKVVPFSGLLFPDQNKYKDSISSNDELFYSIAITFKKLSEKQKLIFFVDDIQWLDKASHNLLKYLHAFFQNHTGNAILFLYTCRPDKDSLEILQENQIVHLSPFTNREYIQFLTTTFSLDKKSATAIIDWVGQKNSSKGNMHWILQILDMLLKDGHITKVNGYFTLSEEILNQQILPIPDDFRLAIREELNKFDEYRNIIGVAAVIGLQFDVKLVSSSLQLDRLSCLEALHQIESQSNILFDIPEKDGFFSFTSSFTLETIREEIGIFEAPDKKQKIKQIIKEYYAIVASSYENVEGPNDFLKLASFYYNSGPVYAEKAVVQLLKAANYCIDVFQYSLARKYFAMTESLTHFKPLPEYNLEIGIARMRITVNEGKNLEISSQEVDELLKKQNNLTPKQLGHFAGYYYHIRNFKKGLEVSDAILERSDSVLDKATGYHWKALCLAIDEADKKIKFLGKALDELNNTKDPAVDEIRLKSHILNSLGEKYSRLATTDNSYKSVAVDYFEKSIQIKNAPETQDRLGLALAYGGLGRLELYVDPVNPKKALSYFKEDLELSKITGDYKGQVKMHSFMGACYLKMDNFEKAVECYHTSKELSTDPVDTFFALLGLVEVSGKKNGPQLNSSILEELSILFKENSLSEFCTEALEKIAKGHPQAKELKEILVRK